MSIFTTDFESDAAGSFPAGFTSWTTPNPWSVQGAEGLHSLRNGNAEGYILHSSITPNDNCIYRISLNGLTSGDFRWWIFFRSSSFDQEGVIVGQINENNYIDIYEANAGVWTRRANKFWNISPLNGYNNVEIALRDKSIVVECSGAAGASVNYDSLVGNIGIYGPILWSNNNSKQFDNIRYITHNFTTPLKDDSFNNSSIDSQWEAVPVTGTSWVETTELKLSGTASTAGYPVLRTSTRTGRQGWYQEIKYKNITGWTNSQNILFRITDGGPNYYDLGINSGGYYLYKYENSTGTLSAAKPLFGDETTTFHTLKMLWDEYHDAVWAWVDNTFIARISFTAAYWADAQRTYAYAFAPQGVAIDKRFKDFVARSTDQNLISVRSPFITNRPDITYDAFL